MWVAFPISQGQQPKKPTRCYFQLSKNIWCPQFDVHKGPLSLSPLSKKARHSVLFTRIRGEFFTGHFTSRFTQPFIPFVSIYLTLEHIFNLKKKKSVRAMNQTQHAGITVECLIAELFCLWCHCVQCACLPRPGPSSNLRQWRDIFEPMWLWFQTLQKQAPDNFLTSETLVPDVTSISTGSY